MGAGFNTNEGDLFVWPFYEKGMNASQYRQFVKELLNGHDPQMHLNATELAEVFARYPPQPQGNQDLAAELATAVSFQCGTECTAQTYSGRNPMFVYRFNHRPACQKFLESVLPGVFH